MCRVGIKRTARVSWTQLLNVRIHGTLDDYFAWMHDFQRNVRRSENDRQASHGPEHSKTELKTLLRSFWYLLSRQCSNWPNVKAGRRFSLLTHLEKRKITAGFEGSCVSSRKSTSAVFVFRYLSYIRICSAVLSQLAFDCDYANLAKNGPRSGRIEARS